MSRFNFLFASLLNVKAFLPFSLIAFIWAVLPLSSALAQEQAPEPVEEPQAKGSSGLKNLSLALAEGAFDVQTLNRIWENRHKLHGSLREFARKSPEIPDEYAVLFRASQLMAYVGHFVGGATQPDEKKRFLLATKLQNGP